MYVYMQFKIIFQFNIIVFISAIQLQTRFELFSSHQYSIKYTNNFFQNLTKPLELYPSCDFCLILFQCLFLNSYFFICWYSFINQCIFYFLFLFSSYNIILHKSLDEIMGKNMPRNFYEFNKYTGIIQQPEYGGEHILYSLET